MNVLDDPERIAAIDRGDMLGKIRSSPRQILEALETARKLELTYRGQPSISKVVVAGIGGSALAGDVAKDWMGGYSLLQLTVCRDFLLPKYVDEASLVIVVSYSGETSQSIGLFKQAEEQGCLVAGISSGGLLEKLCRASSKPHLKVREGLPPRAALLALFTSVAGLLWRYGVATNFDREAEQAFEAVIRHVSKLDVEQPTSRNAAKKIAQGISGSFVVVHSLDRLSSLGRRLKTQLSENSKRAAIFEPLPEACHNYVESLSQSERVLRGVMSTVLVRDSRESPEETGTVEALLTILKEQGLNSIYEIRPDAGSVLSELLATIIFIDYISVYLALLNGVDPLPVPTIDSFKNRVRTGYS